MSLRRRTRCIRARPTWVSCSDALARRGRHAPRARSHRHPLSGCDAPLDARFRMPTPTGQPSGPFRGLAAECAVGAACFAAKPRFGGGVCGPRGLEDGLCGTSVRVWGQRPGLGSAAGVGLDWSGGVGVSGAVSWACCGVCRGRGMFRSEAPFRRRRLWSERFGMASVGPASGSGRPREHRIRPAGATAIEPAEDAGPGRPLVTSVRQAAVHAGSERTGGCAGPGNLVLFHSSLKGIQPWLLVFSICSL
ncbi:hypothetical protein QF015_003869 [Paenarthrobacter sp. TE4293]